MVIIKVIPRIIKHIITNILVKIQIWMSTEQIELVNKVKGLTDQDQIKVKVSGSRVA